MAVVASVSSLPFFVATLISRDPQEVHLLLEALKSTIPFPPEVCWSDDMLLSAWTLRGWRNAAHPCICGQNRMPCPPNGAYIQALLLDDPSAAQKRLWLRVFRVLPPGEMVKITIWLNEGNNPCAVEATFLFGNQLYNTICNRVGRGT